jgi:hypothetical protein
MTMCVWSTWLFAEILAPDEAPCPIGREILCKQP